MIFLTPDKQLPRQKQISLIQGRLRENQQHPPSAHTAVSIEQTQDVFGHLYGTEEGGESAQFLRQLDDRTGGGGSGEDEHRTIGERDIECV